MLNKLLVPADFMFQLTKEEFNNWRSQTVIPSKSYFGGANPMAFTTLQLNGRRNKNCRREVNDPAVIRIT